MAAEEVQGGDDEDDVCCVQEGELHGGELSPLVDAADVQGRVELLAQVAGLRKTIGYHRVIHPILNLNLVSPKKNKVP